MFTSLKKLIDTRLGRLVALDDLAISNGYFVRVAPEHLQAAAFFLKNDPDTRLILLDQIVAISAGILPWPKSAKVLHSDIEILYQLRSLKLPYRVTLCISPLDHALVPSLGALFMGAHWLEADISSAYNIEFEDNRRELI